MIMRILTPVLAMAALGLIFGVGLAYTLKIFGIKLDPKMFKLISMLPGSNCGACGKAGCAGFAEALARGEATPSGCVVSSEEARRSIDLFLGIDYEVRTKTIAAFLCNGGIRAKNKYFYRGIKSCKAATLLFGGYKACSFGCLGLGDCVRECPFHAITIGVDGLPVVDPKKCNSCGKCMKACPKSLYVLLPEKCYYVKCRSKDTGAQTARACSSGCIACMKCEKACPSGAVKVESNLSKIDMGKCKYIGRCVEVCPTKVIAKRG
ncbi:MAG: RnfABCDGE type electron transport complex subunit B [Candidatus Omnitrophica bacterium]|nr:RnfABCDGE type electron transport complex subunit B [Candidatus Omnitrophota bacterium]MBU1037474.1 RnfABCDGE type electron transport complex subunit B [Candidatus Omnitrophota bacterium]MBU1809095.1 RnfABCDGE type electron transport complex subunit B [Candidatus Omnitrophota bacterium]